jgi:hypothetical protein
MINKTDIIFIQEQTLLNKCQKYNLHSKQKQWIRNLALEAESAITLLPPIEQDYTRYQVARNIKKLQNQQASQKVPNSGKLKDELRILNQIKGKLQKNNALVTKADKGNSTVIICHKD